MSGSNTGNQPLPPLPPSVPAPGASPSHPPPVHHSQGQQPITVHIPRSDSPPSSTSGPPPPPLHPARAATGACMPSNATLATSALSLQKVLLDDGLPVSPSGRVLDLGLGAMRERDADGGVRMSIGAGNIPVSRERLEHRRTTGLDWIVPMGPPVGPSRGPKSVVERLTPTIENARVEERRYTRKATITGYAINIAIGLEVLISAIITALSAVTSGKHPETQVMTSVLGGVGMIVASYLARARGSNEPELSIVRAKDLQCFIRECDAFVQDHGYETGNNFDDRINGLRSELERLLGSRDGENKLSPV